MGDLEEKADDLIKKAENGISSIIGNGISSKNNFISKIEEKTFDDLEDTKHTEKTIELE